MDFRLNCYIYFSSIALLRYVFCSSETVQIEIVEKPEKCERSAKNGDMISMKYKGNLFNPATKEIGKEFDSNFEGTDTFDFRLGAGQVVQGWEQGIPGMCVGEVRKLTIPPSLGYGDRGFTDLIPPKSTLFFQIQIHSIHDGPPVVSHGHDHGEHDHEQDSFAAIDTNGDKQISSEEMAAYIKKFNEEGGEDTKFENIDTIVGEIFQEDDKNKDGVISIDEYQQFEEPDEDEAYEGEQTAVDESDIPEDEDDDDDDEYEDRKDIPREEL